MMTFELNEAELAELGRPTSGSGGWQSLLDKLRNKVDDRTGQITLTDSDLERIRKYAFDYGQGGFESRLIAVFGRHLGPKLGR